MEFEILIIIFIEIQKSLKINAILCLQEMGIMYVSFKHFLLIYLRCFFTFHLLLSFLLLFCLKSICSSFIFFISVLSSVVLQKLDIIVTSLVSRMHSCVLLSIIHL